MSTVAQEVEKLMSEAPAFAGSTLDKWWYDIGNGKDDWIA
ncbi:hypothetical protein GCM10007301_28140 [Azorhizobium oxalatiphilum]|uniref:Uncharacterized protein n=1 Tax=Azorhizobium oxalatiphilum TaxID=980631 RepID=A0A917FE53_9HYPH|nr:hypothetical protein GCM10007301_28140 [Azorhizobium oxalatiphilum]